MKVGSEFLKITGRRAPRGLTLLELVVVLVILVALAGVLIPTLPSMLSRAHTATSAAALAEITNNVQLYNNLYQSEPNNWDSLLENTGVDLWGAQPVASFGPLGSAVFEEVTLVAGQVNSLAAAGITEVSDMEDWVAGPVQAPENVTFDPYAIPAARTLAVGGALVGLTNPVGVADLVVQLGEQPTLGTNDFFAVFGIGQRCTAVGKTMASPPVHFSDVGTGPTVNYQRFVAIYRVFGDGSRAQFVGAVALHEAGELSGLGDHIGEYYEATKP